MLFYHFGDYYTLVPSKAEKTPAWCGSRSQPRNRLLISQGMADHFGNKIVVLFPVIYCIFRRLSQTMWLSG